MFDQTRGLGDDALLVLFGGGWLLFGWASVSSRIIGDRVAVDVLRSIGIMAGLVADGTAMGRQCTPVIRW